MISGVRYFSLIFSVNVTKLGHAGIPGLWTQELNAGLQTLDAGLWTLILRTALILCSQRRNDTLIILQTKNRAGSFFITGKYHTKKQNHEPCKGVLKKSYSLAKIRHETTTVTLFYSNNIGCSPMAKDVTYTLL